MTDCVRAARRRLRDESGFSMFVLLMLLLVGSLLSIAAYDAANGDVALSGGDQDRKQAYSAAEAGADYYAFHLAQDNAYWTNCTNVPAPGPGQPNPINQPWNGSGNDPRIWRSVPGTEGEYTVELLPANGYAACDPTKPELSMLNQGQGTFQIRSTGRVRGTKRSIVSTFRRTSFLDFLYFTDYETMDPVANAVPSGQCAQYRRAGRPEPPCSTIVFASGDKIEGPLHTNDDIVTCGSPTFGRSAADSIEVSAPAPGWSNGGCGGAPNFVGTWKAGAPVLAMPASNSALKGIAAPAYLFTGTTTIQLQGSKMIVTNATMGLNATSMPMPSNGVVYVQNGACGTSYSLYQNYNDPPGCANLFVSGSSDKSLTLGSENDVIVTGDVRATGTAVLGIVPNNFARIYHPVTNRNGNTCTNAANSPRDITIDAAILSLQHSLIVDNYFCGAPLGTLTVTGAIAQRFRGPVGTGGAVIATGYLKHYAYNDRLKFVNPPYFLSPLQAAWKVIRFTEQVPPR
jgi:hypothetical protein